ncbi:MAG: glycoside hydrolase family 73 protein [Candidatus Pacearchaeota archaeon]
MNKKGDGLQFGWEQFIEIALVIGFIVLLVFAAPRLFATFFSNQKTLQAKGTLDNLTQKLNALNEAETVSYFLFAPSGWKIVAFDSQHNENKEFQKPSKYFGQNALCVCEKKCTICQTLKLPLKKGEELALIPIEVKELWFTNVKEYFNVSEERPVGEIIELSEEEQLATLTYNPSSTKIDEWLTEKGSPLAGLGQCILDTSSSTKIPFELILAVAIHESGWGKSGLTQQCKNLFGFVTVGPAGTCEMLTTEYTKQGQQIQMIRPFAKYTTPCQSIAHFGKIISTSSYYKEAMKYTNDPIQMAYAIHGCSGPYAGGKCIYATDPQWATKVINYINEIKTAQLTA